MDSLDFERLTNPASVAVVGASETTGSYGWRIMRILSEYGTARRRYAVNHRRAGQTMFGLPVYGSLRELPETPDCTLIAVPPAVVPGVLEEMATVGGRAGIIVTAPHGAGEAQAREFDETVRTLAARHDLQLIGPNSMGLISASNRFAGTFGSGMLTEPGEADPAPAGSIAMLSQSGAAISYLLEQFRGRHVGYSHLISTGNEVVLNFVSLLDNLITDEATRTIVLFIESVSDGRALYDAIARARSAGKAVVIMKIGNSDAGRLAAQSHSGRLAGSSAPYEALAAELGVIRANGYQELFDAVSILNAYPPGAPRPRWSHAHRTAIITTSGGAAVVGIDNLRELGWSAPSLRPETRLELRRVLGESSDVDNPLDLLDLWRDENRIANALRVLDRSGDVDQVLVILGGGGPKAALVCRTAAHVATGELSIPTVFAGVGLREEGQRALEEVGAAFLPDISRAVVAIRERARCEELPRNLLSASTAGDRRSELPAGGALPAGAMLQLLQSHGITCAPFALLDLDVEVERLQAVARDLGLPVVLKLEDPRLLHKSDVKAVLLDLRSPDEVAKAFSNLRILAADLGLAGARLLVQRMIRGVEVLVGARRDAQFGQILVAGLGGVLTELLDDVRPAILPVDRDRIARLIGSHSRLARLLDGYRSAERPDVESLVEQVESIARWIYANGDQLTEVDINPIVVDHTGAFVVDARAVVS